MEKKIMKIKRLLVKNLHGHVGYDISFNDTITFLYGDNGCGKTTILDIVTCIITGRIYKLFDYSFDEIVLTYQAKDSKKAEEIIVTCINTNEITVNFLHETTKIDQRIEYIGRSSEEREDINRIYFSEYPVLEKIKNTFNYIYLPLNRNSILSLEFPYFFRKKREALMRYKHVKGKFVESRIDSAIYEVDALVANAFNKSTSLLNRINEEFSDNVLKSFLDVEYVINSQKAFQYIQTLTPTKIKEMKSEYIKVLKMLNKWNYTSDEKINTFFDSIQNHISLSENGDIKLDLEFLFMLSQLSRITNIIDKAEETEEAKKEAKRPIETFLNTVNKFFASGVCGKEICIDDEGTLFLSVGDDKTVDIQNMSSGEKQIVTFFAYLVFGLENTKQSIFIVDEPELSLHLNWQRQFVDSIMNINSNVQLIFATHAPEVIGRHRDKAVKLIPRL